MHGDALSITLTKPSPDFLERLALPYFCPVPIGMPFVPGAPHQAGESPTGGYIDSAGPYYVADFNNERWVILKRNPNYHGPRPHTLDVIAIREGVDAAAALNLVQSQGWDGITHLSDPLMDPGGVLDQRWGADPASQHRYYLAPAAGTDMIAFNTARGVFADPRVRRAASLALDRSALAATWGDLPTDDLLSPALPGDRHNEQTSPLSPSIVEAKALMHGRTGHAVMPVASDCEPCAQLAHLVQADLGRSESRSRSESPTLSTTAPPSMVDVSTSSTHDPRSHTQTPLASWSRSFAAFPRCGYPPVSARTFDVLPAQRVRTAKRLPRISPGH